MYVYLGATDSFLTGQNMYNLHSYISYLTCHGITWNPRITCNYLAPLTMLPWLLLSIVYPLRVEDLFTL